MTDEQFWTIENLKSHDTYQKFSILMKKIVRKGGVPDKLLLNIFQIQARRIIFSSEKKYLGVEDYTLLLKIFGKNLGSQKTRELMDTSFYNFITDDNLSDKIRIQLCFSRLDMLYEFQNEVTLDEVFFGLNF